MAILLITAILLASDPTDAERLKAYASKIEAELISTESDLKDKAKASIDAKIIAIKKAKIRPNQQRELLKITQDALKVLAAEHKAKVVPDFQLNEKPLQEMNDWAAALNNLIDARDGNFAPRLPMHDLKAGQIGMIDRETIKVLQVLNESEFLVEHRPGRLLWLEGFDTTNIVDGQRVGLKGIVFEVMGGRSYQSVGGAKRTVMGLRKLNLGK